MKKANYILFLLIISNFNLLAQTPFVERTINNYNNKQTYTPRTAPKPDYKHHYIEYLKKQNTIIRSGNLTTEQKLNKIKTESERLIDILSR